MSKYKLNKIQIMKKLLYSLLLLLFSTAVGRAQNQDPSDTICVSTFKELQFYVSNYSTADIKLTADINVESTQGFIQVWHTFSGTITGWHWTVDQETGKKIESNYAIYYQGQDDKKLDCDGPLFTELDGATIDHLTICNLSLKNDNVLLDNDNVGIICRTAKNTTFRNVAIKSVSVFGNDDNVGAVAGSAVGCTFDGLTITDCDVKADGTCAGGVVGRSSGGTFKTCIINPGTAVYADGTSSNAYVGGVCGYSEHDTFSDNCQNMGVVGANNNEVGGIAGYSCESDFIMCNNAGIVTLCGESYFDEIVSAMRAMLTAMTWDELQKHIGSLVVSFDGDDDEMGGICGRAEGGTFESCANEGNNSCQNEYGGGIVGIGLGVTINNCLNATSSYFTEDNCGSIIGSAQSRNGKKTKVTNCFTYVDYPIIGDPDAVDPASCNNYRFRPAETLGNRRETIVYEVEVDIFKSNSGIVARWLNNGTENRLAGKKPWRQDVFIATAPGKPWDRHPVLKPDHLEAKPEYVAVDYEIRTPADLRAFAAEVNSSTEADNKQFLRAALMNDIDMEGEPFTPIGVNASYKQFRGFFDGRGHTIKNLLVSTHDGGPAGLFGTVHVNAEILNVTVGYVSEVMDSDRNGSDCNIRTNTDLGAGGIVGLVNIGWEWGSVVIENCGSYAKIEAPKYAGGILGRVIAGERVKVFVNNCFSQGVTEVWQGNSGVVCGYTQNYAALTNCWAVNKLVSTSEQKPYDDTRSEPEFFAGYDQNIDIRNCYCVCIPQYLSADLDQAGVTNFSMADMADTHDSPLCYYLNGSTNDVTKSLVWQQELGVDPFPVYGNKGVYHTRTLTSDSRGYGTVCLPYAVKSDDEISYYTFSEATDSNGEVTLNFDYAETIPAGMPALFKVRNTGDITITGAGDKWAWYPTSPQHPTATWQFMGTYEEIVRYLNDAKVTYYLSNGVICNAKTVTIKPYRAYFIGPNIDDLMSNQARVRIVIDGEEDMETGLQLVIDDVNPYSQSNKSYTLFGTEAGEGYRGITIRNGKKVLF